MTLKINDMHKILINLRNSGSIISLVSSELSLMEEFYNQFIDSINLKEQDICILHKVPIQDSPSTIRTHDIASLKDLLCSEKLNIVHFDNSIIYNKKNMLRTHDIAIFLTELESFNKLFLNRKVMMITCHLRTEEDDCLSHFSGASSDTILEINHDSSITVKRDRFGVTI